MDLESQAKKALATIYKDDNQSTDTAVHSPKPAEEPKASDSPTIKRTVQPAEKAPEEAVQDSSAVAALYNHHSKVVDAITKTPVTRDSKLAVLYIPGPHTASDRLLKNLTGISEPKIRIITARDSETAWLPQSSNDGQRGYDMHFAFNRLLLAPTLRIECVFHGIHVATARPHEPLVLSLEFHFNPCDGRSLRKLGFRSHKMVSGKMTQLLLWFEANGATCSGFNLAASLRPAMSASQSQAMDLLDSWIQPMIEQKITLLLSMDELSAQSTSDLHKVFTSLPGFRTSRLPSLNMEEYAAFTQRRDGTVSSSRNDMGPYTLMNAKLPHSMCPLASSYTFTSVKEFAVELGYSAAAADAESNEALRLWASVSHRGKLFRIAEFAVLAVTFKPFETLGDTKERVKYRLPRELHSEMSIAGVGRDYSTIRCKGYLEIEPMGLPYSDAFFVITSRSPKAVDEVIRDPSDKDGQEFNVQFTPHYSSFTCSSQMETIELIQGRRYAHWHPIMLNQLHKDIPYVDLTEGHGISDERLAEAEAWLRSWKPWNPEQLRVLDSIHHAKGRFSLTMGIAGTGKTLIQQGLALYFCKLGFRVVAAAPANGNCNHFVKDLVLASEGLRETPSEASADSGVHFGPKPPTPPKTESSKKTPPDESSARITRLFCSSRNVGLKQMSADQAVHRKVGHTDKKVSDLDGLMFKLLSSEDRKAMSARSYALEQAVIDAADAGEMVGMHRIPCRGETVDVWDLFRKHLKAARQEEFDWNTYGAKQEYMECYEWCKRDIVAFTDVMVTTTGNARAEEIVDIWKGAPTHYAERNVKCKGYIVLIDEAAKDWEINLWNTILALGTAVVGVFMFGDDKQLKPINACSKGKLQFNAFSSRLNIPLPCRLVAEGFPHVSLKEQQRMHACLSRFVNHEFYHGQLRDGPKAQLPLEEAMPGLATILHGIVAKAFRAGAAAESYKRTATDEMARAHYIQIAGYRESHERTFSKLVREHVRVFFKHIFPELQKYFGKKTEANLMIICGYGYALQEYKRSIFELQEEEKEKAKKDKPIGQSVVAGKVVKIMPLRKTTDSWYPKVVTIDGSQGQESFMVVVDGSFQKRDRMGFMTDRGRTCVALTRAKGVRWILGGELDCAYGGNKYAPLPVWAKLKQEMAKEGQVHQLYA